MPYRILTLFVGVVLLMSSLRAGDNPRLVVAWFENDSVMVWHTGDAAPTHHAAPPNIAGNTRQLLISADGQYVAVNVAYPGSLWLAASTNEKLVEAVPSDSLPANDPKYIRVGNLQRGPNATFYFNTFDQPSHYTVQHNDLWSLDAASLTVKLLLPSPQAGLFNVSPDRQHIALVQAGVYGTTDGIVNLVDKDAQNRREVMIFPAVSTGSDYDFYPQAYWEADSLGLNIAIPDKDLVYNDNTALTTLWHFGVDGIKTQRGTLQATFFGLPQWSDDGQQIIYLRRKGEVSANQFELVAASGDGSKPIVYASAEAGAIGLPQWLPNSEQFIYSQGEPGDYWLGQLGQPPQALPEKIVDPHFVDSTTYVFTNAAGELRFAHLGDTGSTLIAAVNTPSPIFDALLVP